MVDFAVKSPADAGPATAGAPPRSSSLTRYGLAPVAIAVALAARVAFHPILQDEAPYLFFVPAVLVAAGLGGLGPGLLATALGLVLGSFFVGSGFPNFSQAELVNAAAFAAIGIGMAWGGEQLQRSRLRAAASAQETLAARGPPSIDSRHRPRRHGGHRRARHHALVQLGGGAAVRLLRRGGHRKECQDADALALSRGP